MWRIRCKTAAAAGQRLSTLSAPVPYRRRGRHHMVKANLWEVLTPGSLTPVVTSTIIAAATVILNLVAGIVTERKRAELSLEVCCSAAAELAVTWAHPQEAVS